MGRHPFAKHEEFPQAQRLADFGASLAADDDGFELGQIAFKLFGKLLEQLLTHYQSENRVTEKLEALVRGVAGVLRAPGPVHERRRELVGVDVDAEALDQGRELRDREGDQDPSSLATTLPESVS